MARKNWISILFLFCFSLNAISQSLDFDGTNDYVSVNANSQFYFTNAMTVEAWINADTWKSLLYKGTVVSMGNNVGGNKGFDLRAAEGGKAEFNISIGGIWVSVTSDAIMQNGEWNHLAGVFNGDSLKLYINGILEAKVAASGTISYSTGKLYIAECPGWSGRNFDGKIDEVRLWNVARSSDEIRASIASELLGNETGLAAYYKFNENTGSSTADATGHNLTGTLVNMSTSTVWTSGFVCTLNDPDAGVGSLVAPLSAFSMSNNESIKILINNYSLQSVQNIPVHYSINGGPVINEICTNTIPALGSYVYTFTQTSDLSLYGNYSILVSASAVGDVDGSNNILEKEVTNFAPGSNFGLAFDGLDDEVLITNNAAINPTNALTVEAWINADQWKNNIYEGSVIGKVQGDPDRGYNLGVGSNGCAEFQISDNGSWNGAQSGPILKLGRWYHLAGVYDGSSVKLYINGVLQNQKTAGTIKPSSCDLMIGECPSWGGGRNFKGKIDEVRIWNVARTEAEIKNCMTQSLIGNEAGLAALYKFNEGLMKDTIRDSSAYLSFGKLNNFDLVNAWVSGFSLDSNDVGISALISPSSGPLFGASKVKVKVKNFGFNAINKVKLSFRINGSNLVTDTLIQSILPFSEAEFTFNTLVDLSVSGPSLVEVFSQMENDTDRSNDTLRAMISPNTKIIAFDNVRHSVSDYGQIHYNYVSFPENIEDYDSITMHISLACPSSGCDPWDQTGKISLIDEWGRSIELGRFITPYGMAYDGWDIDVTDFKSVLRGNVLLQSYIQVFGNSGWLLSVSFDLHQGESEFRYSSITPLWNTDYQVYGDPSISYDLPIISVDIAANTQSSILRLTTTGHGQGNTDNAAEFADKTHTVSINGGNQYTQHLWNDQCDENPCSPQNGTWQYSRAGWCPGMDVKPFNYNITSNASAGNTISLDYVLQSYTNLLNSAYNGGSHTEPHFRIHSYLIQHSNEPYDSINDGAIIGFASPLPPTNADLTSNEVVSIRVKNTGHYTIDNPIVSYSINGNIRDVDTLQTSISPDQEIVHSFSSTADFSTPLAQYSLSAMIICSNDIRVSNDVKSLLLQNPTAIDSPQNDPTFDLFPNPATEQICITLPGINIEPTVVKIFNAMGTKVFQESIANRQNFISIAIFCKGVYFVSVENSKGTSMRKIIIQ